MIPMSVLDQHLIALGKTGAGKSYALRVLIERLLDEGRRVCIVDPKGDHWGIKSSADGKKAGYPVVIFGGDHADVPINPRVGHEVAELVATGNRPCVIDFRGWMPGDRTRFWIDFASTLFKLNRSPLWLVIDEVHNFAPQGKVLDPEAGKCLHWTNRIASEGRGIGIHLLLASQRPQKVHKDTVTCAETLVAMRVIHKLDRDAMKDWVDGAGDPERGKTVMNSLAEMKRGEAFVWYPEAKYFERLTFPTIKTFDSFKSPTGDEKNQTPKGWAEVNLDEVRTKLAKTFEEAKANDPNELKKKIRELESQLRSKKPGRVDESAITRAMEQAKKEAGRQNATTIQGLERTVQRQSAMMKRVAEMLVGVAIDMPKHVAPTITPRPVIVRPQREPVAIDTDVKLGAGARRMLGVLLQFHPNGMPEGQMRSLAGLRKSGTFTTYMSQLRTAGLLEEQGGLLYPTEGAIAQHGHEADAAPSTTEEVVELWGKRLGAGARRMLDVLVQAGGEYISEDDLLTSANLAKSGTFTTYKSQLRTANLIITRQGEIAANSETLFL